MDKIYQQKFLKLEEGHWWFIGRREMICDVVEGLFPDKKAKILEIGCSGGLLMTRLAQEGFGDVCGLDISEAAIEKCQQKGLDKVYRMDGVKTGLDGGFDLIIASDVLEHIGDDASALAEWHRLLKPSGNLVIFVPAFQFLWSAHDEVNHHHRRYSRQSLEKKMINAGFTMKRSSYWNFTLFFPIAFVRALQRLMTKGVGADKDQLFGLRPWANRTLIALLRFENRLCRRTDFPVGVSVFAIGQK